MNDSTLKKLHGIASCQHLSKAVRKLSYRPYIRKQSPGPRNQKALQHFAEQSQILSRNSLGRALVFALQSFKSISAIKLEFPEHGKRAVSGGAPVQILREVISNIFSRSMPSLSSLSIQSLEPEDMPGIFGLEATDASATLQLPSLNHLELEFYAFDVPNCGAARDITGMDELSSPLRLPRLLERLESLVILRITFTYLDKRIRLVDWTSVRCSRLRTIELRTLEISESSLQNLILPSAGSLRETILTDIFLTNGTWASFYRSISELKSITDIGGFRGRRYLDDRWSYSASDAASFCELFRAVETRRAEIGLPSMRDPVRTESMELIPDFWEMEHAW